MTVKIRALMIGVMIFIPVGVEYDAAAASLAVSTIFCAQITGVFGEILKAPGAD